MKVGITALGTAVPPYRQNQLAAVDIITHALQLSSAKRRLLRSVYKATGIQYRHSVLSDFCSKPGDYVFFPNDPLQSFPSTAARMRAYKQHALPLALEAIRDCFAHQPAPRVTHLITVSCTGMYAPGLDIELVNALGLASTVKRTAVNFMGCYGAFNGIKLAHAICEADPQSKVLVVCVELCTLHLQKADSLDHLFSNALFADGAAAVLIESIQNQTKSFEFEGFHCDMLPQHTQAMAWEIADEGFDIILSSYVPQAIEAGIGTFLNRLLVQQAMRPDQIDFYAIHPGGKKILEACEVALGLTAAQNAFSYGVLEAYGNMSSATVLFVLKAIWQRLNADDTEKSVFSCAFGPGLTLESMMLKVGVKT